MMIVTIAMTAWMTADDNDDHGHGNRRDHGDGDGECGGAASDEQTSPVTLSKHS